MAKNKLSDLRDHLFETLESLRDTEKPMDIDRAKAVAQVAGKIIESAKVQIKYEEVTGRVADTGFFPDVERKTPELPDKTKQRTLPPANGNSVRPSTM